MTIDAPLLRKELEFITAHRNQWNQTTWLTTSAICGTRGCLFGNALFHAGEVESITCDGDDGFVPTGGRTWQQAGAELFGLNSVQAMHLSNASNTLSTLWALASEFTEGEIEIPEEIWSKEI